MLQRATLPEPSMELLGLLSPVLFQRGFYLAGGTALALRMGHRVSVDLDFFSEDEFDPDGLLNLLEDVAKEVPHVFQKTEGSLCVALGDTKMEFFHYPYALLSPVEDMEGLKLVSIIDNGVMKFSALMNRGTKKDFADVAVLLEVFSLSEWMGYYQEKYSGSDLFMLVKSLTWFDDAEGDPDPRYLKGQTWESVKSMVSSAVGNLGD